MKQLFSILFTVLVASTSIGQDQDQSSRKSHSNSFGISVEKSEGIDFASDAVGISSLATIPKQSNYGFNLFYEHTIQFDEKWGLNLGIGANATVFSQSILFKNITGQGLPDTKQYLLGDWKNTFLATDLSVSISRSFRLKGTDWTPSVRAGIKLRQVNHIFNENRNTSISGGTLEFNGEDTVYYNEYELDYGTLASRIVAFSNLGFSISKPLSNGGGFNFFADYNLQLVNQVEIYYSELDNVENGTQYTFPGGSPIFLALKMSHFRIGASYTLPRKK